MEFVLNGESLTLDETHVERAVSRVTPEEVRQHGVRIGGVVFPVKQAFSVATGLSLTEFTSDTALRLLARLGFEVIGEVSHREKNDSQPSSEDRWRLMLHQTWMRGGGHGKARCSPSSPPTCIRTAGW